MISMVVLLAALPAGPSLPEYDAFGESSARSLPAVYSPGARARIEAGWVSNEEPRLGVPTFFWAPRDPTRENAFREIGLTAEQAARRWLFLYGELYRQDPATLAAQPVQEVHDLGDGAVIVRFRKVSHGVPVFRDTLNVVMTQGLQLVALSGYLSPHDHPREFRLAAPTAISIALQDASGGWLLANGIRSQQRVVGGWESFTLASPQSGGPARARKVLYPLADRLEAAWQLELTVLREDGTDDGYSYVVSAEDGRLLMRHDLTSHAGYRVWADATAPFVPWDGPQGIAATPNPTGLLDGYQAPPVAPQLVTVNAISPVSDPWLPAGALTLTGNNVEAYADLLEPDGFNADGGDVRVPASSPGVFDWTYDLGKRADSASSQRFASATSAFFVANWAHDVLYAQGFDEKSGNGQQLNFGRGGLAGDFMRVEVQDYFDRNNATMRTPADGMPARMHTYLFDNDGPSLVGLSSDGGPLDAGMLPASPGDFGPQAFDLTGNVVRGYDGIDAGWDGCDALLNAAEVTGNIALFEVSKCPYVNVARNAADAGAIGILITYLNQGLAPFTGPPGTVAPPILLLQRDAGVQLALRLDAGEVTTARMYRPQVIERDSALDATVVAHEYAHFLSQRLVSDSNGLLNQQARSLGEGWSDFFALWMMVRESDGQVPTNNSWKGTWAIGSHSKAGTQLSGAGNPAYYLGTQRYPYSANFAKNALTYKHIQLGQALPAVPGAPTGDNNEIHNAGEVWCSMLWEGYVAMLNAARLSFPVAQERMLGYLVASLKVTPPMPTYLEARDAFLSVVAAKDPQDLVLWTQAFARRGMGYKATGPDRFALDNKPVVEDPSLLGNFVRVTAVALDDQPAYCDKDGVLDVGEQGTLKLSLLNVGASALSSTTALVTTTVPGVTFTNNGVAVFGPMGSFGAATATLGISLTAATGPVSLPLEITVNDPSLTGGNLKTRVTLQVNTDSVPATVEHCEGDVLGWTADILSTAPSAYEERFLGRPAATGREFTGPDVVYRADSTLVTPLLEVGTTPFTVTFKHRWSFETAQGQNYDGARIEYKPDDGDSWFAVQSSALTPPYNGTVRATSASSLRGSEAFVAQSPGYPAMVSQTLDLGTALAGKKVRLRFLIATDASGGAPGWAIDDLQFTGLLNKPFFDVVKDRAMCVNRPPAVSLGADRSVDERSTVDLMPQVTDADGEVPTLTWMQLSGPAVTLTGNTFVAPEVAADTALSFQATVSDGKATALDAVVITVKNVNRIPLARAGDPQDASSGAVVTLGGSGVDPDGDPLTFTWTQIGGPDVALSNSKTAQPTFTAPGVDTASLFTFSLVASDGVAQSPAATVDVTVNPVKSGCGCSGAPDAFGLFALALTLRAGIRRRRR